MSAIERSLLRRSGLALVCMLSVACGEPSSTAIVEPPAEPAGPAYTVELISGLAQPWGIAQLPDERFLITQRDDASFVLLDASGQSVIATIPSPLASSWMMDVVLDPDFDQNSRIYWTFAEPGLGAEAGLHGTAVGSATLVGNTLQNVDVIFSSHPKTAASGHYGSRLAFRSDGTLFVSIGDHDNPSESQVETGTIGKVVRINRDGSIPGDNPMPAGWAPEIWSIGHRNPQAAATRPGTDDLWLVDHGPQGGDELNYVEAGTNHGWPNVSYGCNYGDPAGSGCEIGGGTHAAPFVEPVSIWVPWSMAPSGMIFYDGDRFPDWRGSIFAGGLSSTSIWRVELAGDVEVSREELFGSLGERVRDIHEGLDGWIYFVTDSGRFLQVRN